jgi:hypothetical protein
MTLGATHVAPGYSTQLYMQGKIKQVHMMADEHLPAHGPHLSVSHESNRGSGRDLFVHTPVTRQINTYVRTYACTQASN